MAIGGSRLKKQILAGALIGALAALFVACFGHLMLWHRSSDAYASTGATQGVDLWTYYSMARSVWRSPNGLTYAYPYALYWPVPPVAFQLPITLLAWLGRLTGLPLAFEIGRVAGAAGAGAALGAIGALFPRGFWRRWFYIAAVFGGGFFSLGTIALAIDTAGLPGLTEPHQYQPKSEGRLFWWLPFLVRNLRMPMECIYHAMVMGALACLAWRRFWMAWVLGLFVWMSNPFAAVALHAAVVPWYAWRTVESRGRIRRHFALHLAAWLAVNAIAALYYGWFLNQWALMRELHNLYKIQFVPALEWWRLMLLILPYGLALLLTVTNKGLRRAIWGRPVWRLFALLAVAHVLLIQQSAFLGEHAMQSYHYNRGYLQLGLVVVAWRVVVIALHRYRCLVLPIQAQCWWPNQISDVRCRRAAYIVCGIVTFSCLDQVFFAAYAVGKRDVSSLINSHYASLVRQIPATPAPAIVVTEPVAVPGSYVSAFSPHIAWDADETMVVPFWDSRKSWLREAMAGEHGGVTGLGIDYAIVYNEHEKWLSALKEQGWKQLAEDGYFILLKAPVVTPGATPRPPVSLKITR